MTNTKPLTGVAVLATLLVSFAVVIAVNTTFVLLSVRTFPGEEEAESYVQGLKYNATLADRSAQAALGWRATACIKATGRNARIEVEVYDASHAHVEGLAIKGALRRPLSANLDRSLTLIDQGDGVYETQLDGLVSGQWDLALRAIRGSSHFDIEKRLTWLPAYHR